MPTLTALFWVVLWKKQNEEKKKKNEEKTKKWQKSGDEIVCRSIEAAFWNSI